jgi:XTP/dITP diphosphohydrolase
VKKIVIASTNPGNITEIKIGLQQLEKQGIELLTLSDVVVGEKEPEETGKTFQENSFIKAKFYADIAHIPVISDDGGLVIPYLNNEPGVKSKRWLGRDATDLELIGHALHNLRGCTGIQRKAYLETCLCFYEPKTKLTIYETERILGSIAKKSNQNPLEGYPYRAIFIVDRFNKFYDELTKKEHQQVNHRLIALKRLTKKIEDLI